MTDYRRTTGTNEVPDRTNDVQIRIPRSVATAIEDRIEGTDFESADGYVTYVLEALLCELDRNGPKETTDGDRSEASDTVEDRLESLGYL